MASAMSSPILQLIRRMVADQGGREFSDQELLQQFHTQQSEAAFVALLGRHGPMVLDVCHGVLGNEADAEDAFQATFLILARKAGSIRKAASLGSWLHGVARRTALKARAQVAARRKHENRVPVRQFSDPDDLSWREVREVVHEELTRISERFRAPLVLCYLEGITQDAAAAQLGLAKSTLRERLERGRDLLRARLVLRGLAPAVFLVATAWPTAKASATVPISMMASTLKGAMAVVVGTTVTAVVPAEVASLSEGVLRIMRLTKLKFATAFLLTIAALGIGGLLVHRHLMAADSLGVPADLAPQVADKPAVEKAHEPAGVRIGVSRFRARGQISDVRYGVDGRRVIGLAKHSLYIWDAGDGSLVRTISTMLEPPEDPTRPGESGLAFAVHPRGSRVACGGVQAGKTYLRVWDYETGMLVAERVSNSDALKTLAWTPDGKLLLELAKVGWMKPTGWKLIVRDGQLAEVRSHDLPKDFSQWSTLMHPLPGGEQVILWQSDRDPTVIDLASGAVIRTLPYRSSIPSDLVISPDGKTLAVTSTEDLRLLNFPGGDTRTKLPVLRRGWEKPRPLFSPDGTTVYVWDHRPIAYDVASGKEKWKATFRTVHTVRVQLSDVSPDGATLLVRHGHAVSRLDAKTGAERDPPDGPSSPPGLVWAPDGKMLFTRAVHHDRTWTAWDPVSGRRLYDLLPTGFVTDENWKLLPDLFFLRNGKEVVIGLEKSESTEQVGPKELLVFDAVTGQCLRRLGEPLPDATFRWMHPIGVDPFGATVVMQAYAVEGSGIFDPRREYQHAVIRWDPIKKARLQEWTARGQRVTPPHHFAPYTVTLAMTLHDPNPTAKRADPAKIRCYSLAEGRLIHELQTEHACIDLDRIQGNFLLAAGYDSTWITRGNSSRYTPQPPFAHDLWELPTKAKIRLFQAEKQTQAVLGPDGEYVIRVLNENTIEVYEPFALKRAVMTIATPGRPKRFEFSSDGSRVAVALTDATIVVWDATPWRQLVSERLAQVVPADLAPLWDDLGKDAETGLRACRLLAAAGDRALALLKGKLDFPKVPDEAVIKQLIADLGAPAFVKRERAEKDLRDIAGWAEPHLRNELRTNPSLEVKRRIEKVLQTIASGQRPAAEIRALRAVQALAWMNTAAARELLVKWAKGDPSRALTKAAVAATRPVR